MSWTVTASFDVPPRGRDPGCHLKELRSLAVAIRTDTRKGAEAFYVSSSYSSAQTYRGDRSYDTDESVTEHLGVF